MLCWFWWNQKQTHEEWVEVIILCHALWTHVITCMCFDQKQARTNFPFLLQCIKTSHSHPFLSPLTHQSIKDMELTWRKTEGLQHWKHDEEQLDDKKNQKSTINPKPWPHYLCPILLILVHLVQMFMITPETAWETTSWQPKMTMCTLILHQKKASALWTKNLQIT